MKKLVIIFTFTFLILFPSPVLAESVEVSVRNVVNSNKPVKQEIRTKVSAKREEIKEKLSAARRERVRSYFARVVTRIEALIERLENLISRMEARIETIQNENPDLDTSAASADIAKAKTLINNTKENLALSQEELEDTLSSDDPKDAFKGVVEIMKETKSDLREIHRLLVHAIGELKGLRVGEAEK